MERQITLGLLGVKLYLPVERILTVTAGFVRGAGS
jgi:hypothetical protein